MTEQTIQRQLQSFENIVVGASTTALLGGIAAVVLSILGLMKYTPTVMAAVAVISLGATFALNGFLLVTERSRVASSHTVESAQFSGGVSMEVVAGIAAIVLGILTLLKVDIAALLPVAALGLGIGMIFSSGVLARLNLVAPRVRPGQQSAEWVSYSMVALATGTHILVGVGVIALAILALIGFAPVPLTLVALLALGAASSFSGASVTGRMLSGTSAA